MLDWLRNELNEDLRKTVFDFDFIQAQALFRSETIRNLERQLFSKNPGDVHATLWTFVCFFKSGYKKNT